MTSANKLVWTKNAQKDLNVIVDYIAKQDPLNADTVLLKIIDKVDTLKALPDQGRLVPELKAHGIMIYKALIISPWRIIYRYHNNQAIIMLVIDARRDIEDYLLNRLLN